MILVRRLLGDVLRRERMRQGRTLRDVSGLAQVSLGYLSEIERGQKEASSECLASICQALAVPLSSVLAGVSSEIARAEHELALSGVPELLSIPMRIRSVSVSAGVAAGRTTAVEDLAA